MEALNTTYDFKGKEFPNCRVVKLDSHISVRFEPFNKLYPCISLLLTSTQELINLKNVVASACEKVLREAEDERKS